MKFKLSLKQLVLLPSLWFVAGFLFAQTPVPNQESAEKINDRIYSSLPKYYVGASAGQARYRDMGDRDGTLKVFAGKYLYGSGTAIEISFQNYGEAKFSGLTQDFSVKLSSVEVSYKALFELNKKTAFDAGIGLKLYESEVESSLGRSDTNRDIAIVMGFGFSRLLTRDVYILAHYEMFNADFEINDFLIFRDELVHSATGGIAYRF